VLAKIAPLLAELRRRAVLREGRPGHFFLGRQEILHFHDDPDGVFADLRLSDGFVRLRATSDAEQAELLGRIDERLDAVEWRAAERDRRQRRGRDA
jgi:hypothetical protein